MALTSPYPFAALPSRRGHFLLESGYHTDIWLDLDTLFVDSVRIAPAITMLAARLRRYECDAVCGPMTGGALLAQALAATLRVCFFYTQPWPPPGSDPNGTRVEPKGSDPERARARLFSAEYRLPGEMRRQVAGSRVAVVDDVISAGSSVRATVAALSAARASTVVVATLVALGDVGIAHFRGCGIPFEALERREFAMWAPRDCPLCRDGAPLTVADG